MGRLRQWSGCIGYRRLQVSRAYLVVQSLKTGARRVLVQGAGVARYVPTGYLVYSQSGTLMAAPFDVRRLELTRTPVPVVEDVAERVSAGFSFSRSGSLVYVPQASRSARCKLVWVVLNKAAQDCAGLRIKLD